MSRDQRDAAHLDGRKKSGTRMDLTDKERLGRGLDALGEGLRPIVDERMTAAVHGKVWVPLYEAKESARLGRPFKAEASDPRLLLRIMRHERAVFTDVDASQRAWAEELIQTSNRWAHAAAITRQQTDRALDTMILLAESLDLELTIERLVTLRAGALTSGPSVTVTDDRASDSSSAPALVGADLTTTNLDAPAPHDVVEPLEDSVLQPEPIVPGSGQGGRRAVSTGVRPLSVRVGSLDVVVVYHEAINYALIHNGVSPLVSARLRNTGDVPIEIESIEVSIDPLAQGSDVPVAIPLVLHPGILAAGAEIDVPAHQLAWRVNVAPFLALDESATTAIALGVRALGASREDSGPLRLLTVDEWWARGIPESIAAFVRPNDPVISTLLGEAAELLAARTGSPSLEGYQSGPERVHQIAEAIYDAMQARQIRYVEPPASFEGTGQRVRSHAQVLDERWGTCLDLACTYAAALEQAGVRPILALVEGHAFAGFLTEDSQLPTIAVVDLGIVTTIADSSLFDAVETTALCSGESTTSFDEARGHVRRWWTADLDELRFLLDVHAAHRRVKPLPTIRKEGDTRVVEVVREAVSIPARRIPAQVVPTGASVQAGSDAPARIEKWRRALLDMTYMNPLLKRKDASSIPLHVPAGGIGAFEDKIASKERVRLVPHDELAAIHSAQGARTARDVDTDVLRRILEEENTLYAALSTKEYRTKLVNLARKARTVTEETGTNNLYLTLGTLEWTERAKKGAAPLFLLPVKLVGGRGTTPFTLEVDDSREMEPNYCLVEKLRLTWGLEIPELSNPGSDDSGIDIDGAFAAVRTAILRSNATSFHVEETAHLALLQFSTLEMWRDLSTNWASFMERPVVRHLVKTAGQPFIDDIDVPEADKGAEATTYLPIPADGSQLEAVRWAAAGKSFILEGPPGTGKSQTITNLISHLLAEGKKVLFVAEKPAALEVVKKRLDDVGLGTFSLDLHGRNQTVSAVREQLTAALEAQVGGASTWDALRSGYRGLVESLSRYPDQVHEEGPVGVSSWEARQVLLELQEIVAGGQADIEVPRALVMGATPLGTVYDAARDLGNALLDLGTAPSVSPWRLAGALDADALDRPAIARALARVGAADQVVSDPILRALTAIARTPVEFEAIAAWLDSARAGVGRSTVEASALVTPQWRAHAEQTMSAVARFRSTYGPQLGVFAPGVMTFDLDGLVARSVAIDGRLFGKKKLRRALLAELAPVMAVSPGEPLPFALGTVTAVLRGLVSVREALGGLVGYAGQLPGIALPFAWNPLDHGQASELDRSVHSLDAAHRLRATLGAGRPEAATAQATADAVTVEVLRTRTPGDVLPGAAVRELGTAWSGYVAVLGANPEGLEFWLAGRSRGLAMSDDLLQWTADSAGGAFIRLQRWVRVRRALTVLTGLGLGVVERPVLSGKLLGPDVENSIRLAVAREVLAERFDSTGLSAFDDVARSRLVERFVDTGHDVRRRMVAELPARIVRARTFDPGQRVGMVADLRQQLSRRRSGLPIRQLLHRYGSLITEITPCVLMSPHSVARFLPSDAVDFDVVVFDEASQIRVPEAIGAMGRGKAVVVVGDSKQMPPTAMFSSTSAPEDEESVNEESLPVPSDLESILSEASESRLPRLLLSWHYRSRDESLIAFSNQHYYDGRLSSFPTPPVSGATSALLLRRVEGEWEGGTRGAARVNRAEAEAVVEEVRRRIFANPGQSIGVVTFNTQQRDLIFDALDADPDQRIRAALDQEVEPVFVKNLENVQGDERDVILFTLAFAKDARGKVPLNWGPLTRAGGERRLNVAVTRAKEQVVIFASFDPHDLDLSTSGSVGLEHLKDYLLLAKNGVEHASLRRPSVRDRHREEVVGALLQAGLEVRSNVGLSDFTVDLAVRTGASSPWVAVMLDGPVWASRGSVGDREGLPSAVLVGSMGWARVERVWLPTWIRDSASVVSTIEAAAKAVGAEPTRGEPEVAGPHSGLAPVNLVGASARGDAAYQSQTIDGLSFESGSGSRQRYAGTVSSPEVSAIPGSAIFRAASDGVRHSTWVLDDATSVRSKRIVRAEIDDIVATEGPILVDRLARTLAGRFDLARVREGRRAQILALIPRGVVKKALNGDLVAWPVGVDPEGYTSFRLNDGEDKRDIGDVPFHELRNTMLAVVRRAHGLSDEDTLRETARVFGVGRLASKVRPRLEDVLDAAVREGRLVERAGMVQAN